MYRDDPLDDEFELRMIVGDGPIDRLGREPGPDGRSGLEVALDVLRLLQGWVEDDEAAAWLLRRQQRLAGLSPLEALAGGAHDDVEDAARSWLASVS